MDNKLPATIDEVIASLEGIIAYCAETGNKAGFFAALYHTVTCKVKDGIASGQFDDGPRMERLDVIFAGRFLQAWQQWQKGEKPTQAWQIAFEGARQKTSIVLQNLFLGINAHINLDLGIAAAQTMQGQDIAGLHNDFNTINTILAALVYGTIHDLDQVSPLMSFMGFHATNTNEMLAQFTIDEARDGAWVFAETLSPKTGADHDACIAARDTSIAKLADSLLRPKKFARLTVWLIWLFEWKKVARIMNVMKS